jgi:hypothetical protein
MALAVRGRRRAKTCLNSLRSHCGGGKPAVERGRKRSSKTRGTHAAGTHVRRAPGDDLPSLLAYRPLLVGLRNELARILRDDTNEPNEATEGVCLPSRAKPIRTCSPTGQTMERGSTIKLCV